jgi:ABC-type polar amino acid transport system ATPase subunit
VQAIADEVGLSRGQLSKPVGALSLSGRLRLRLGRALGPNPQILLAEHPNAMLEPSDVTPFAADYARIIARRQLASVVLTADYAFAAAVTPIILTLQPATGELKPIAAWKRLFR